MNETDKIALSLVPYEPEKKKKRIIFDFFVSRKRMYLLFSVFFVFFFFFGFSYGKKFYYADIDAYIDYFPKWISVMTLVVYISSFTIFSPVISLFTLSFLSSYLAFVFSFSSHLLFPVFAFSAFISIIYFSEIFRSYERAKYGIRQIFKPKPVILISFMTILFLISALLSFRII